MPQWNGPVLYRSLVVTIVLLAVCGRLILTPLWTFGMVLYRMVRQMVVGLVADCGDLQLILGRSLCDVLLVACKRAGPLKRPLRRRVLGLRRRFAAQAIQDEDDLLVGVASEEGTVYRPLMDIQAGAARWGGRRRWRSPRVRPCRVIYNPSGAGDCLFKSFRHIAGCNTPVVQLRAQLKALWQEAFAKDEMIAHRSAQQWAACLGVSPEFLIDTSCRWGNTVDLFLLARAHHTAVKAIDYQTKDRLLSFGSPSSRFAVAWSKNHFFVIALRKKRTPAPRWPSAEQLRTGGDAAHARPGRRGGSLSPLMCTPAGGTMSPLCTPLWRRGTRPSLLTCDVCPHVRSIQLLRSGGGGKKRAHDTGVDLPAGHVPTGQSDDPLVLIYHGSFSPFHAGHRAA
eukprot:2538262-Amphidinium_carterae.1